MASQTGGPELQARHLRGHARHDVRPATRDGRADRSPRSLRPGRARTTTPRARLQPATEALRRVLRRPQQLRVWRRAMAARPSRKRGGPVPPRLVQRARPVRHESLGKHRRAALPRVCDDSRGHARARVRPDAARRTTRARDTSPTRRQTSCTPAVRPGLPRSSTSVTTTTTTRGFPAASTSRQARTSRRPNLHPPRRRQPPRRPPRQSPRSPAARSRTSGAERSPPRGEISRRAVVAPERSGARTRRRSEPAA